MLVYLLLYISVFLLGIQHFYKYNKRNSLIKKKIAFIVFVILGIIAGSRYEIGGTDYNQYKLLFYELPASVMSVISNEAPSSVYRMDMGYLVYSAFIKNITDSFNVFLLITGIVTSIILYFVFTKYSRYFFFSLLIFISKFYSYYFFTAQRQIIAMIICWLSISLIQKRKFLPFALLILIASTFHSSALIFFLAYFLFNIEFTNKQIYYSLFIASLIGFLGIGNLFYNIIFNYLSFLPDKIKSYENIEVESTNVLNYLELIPLFVLLVKNRKFFKNKYAHFNFFLNLFFTFIFILVFFYEYSFIGRVSSYFLLGYVFLVPLLLDLFLNKSKAFEIIIFASLYYLAVYLRYIFTFSDGEGIFPYNSFLI